MPATDASPGGVSVKMAAILRTWLTHPLTRGLDVDDPRTTELRKRVILGKPFLRLIYAEWYREISGRLPPVDGPILELGSGAGFLKEEIPDLIASDVLRFSGNDLALDGMHLPFSDDSLRAVVMINVLHHIPDPERFFREASRCVRTGGSICMLEPWVTTWSRWAYALHAEPFLPEASGWAAASGGPLSGANGALPWMIFARDRQRFESEFPDWVIAEVTPLMPFRYLVSGGISLRSLMPAWSFGMWRSVERALEPWMGRLAMFAIILLRRR